MKKVTIVCDNTLYRIGLGMIVESRGWEAVHIDFGGLESREHTHIDRCELVLASVSGERDLTAAVHSVASVFPTTPTVLVLENGFRSPNLRALPDSFRGLVSATDQSERINAVIDLVLDGVLVLPRDVLASGSGVNGHAEPNRFLKERLTKRETEILKVLALGMSNKEIGRRLQISSNTVDSHVSSIIRKLEVRNRTEAAMFAKGMGVALDDQMASHVASPAGNQAP